MSMVAKACSSLFQLERADAVVIALIATVSWRVHLLNQASELQRRLLRRRLVATLQPFPHLGFTALILILSLTGVLLFLLWSANPNL